MMTRMKRKKKKKARGWRNKGGNWPSKANWRDKSGKHSSWAGVLFWRFQPKLFKACATLGLSDNNSNFIDFLASVFGSQIIRENMLSIHIETDIIFFDKNMVKNKPPFRDISTSLYLMSHKMCWKCGYPQKKNLLQAL